MHNWQTSFFPIFYRLDQTCFGPLSVCVCVCALHQLYLFAAAMLYVCMHGIPPFGVCVCVYACVCVCVDCWLPSPCLAFAARSRAPRLPRGHHCPRSPQPSGHRCSPFDTVLLTHAPRSSRCVGGQAGRPVACHTCTPLVAQRLHVTLKGGSHHVYSFNPATMHNGTEVARSGEESFA